MNSLNGSYSHSNFGMNAIVPMMNASDQKKIHRNKIASIIRARTGHLCQLIELVGLRPELRGLGTNAGKNEETPKGHFA